VKTMVEIWARFSFLFFYSTLPFSFLFYSHVAGAGMASMPWCMRDSTRHAAQLSRSTLLFSWGFILFSECHMDGWRFGKAGMIFDYGCARAE
jgi:hypothetical protein